jgi:hypothetical protein
MRDGLKHLMELASIDLAYARAEIALAMTMGDEKARVERHLDAAAKALHRMARFAAETGAGTSGGPGKSRVA